jgi:H+-translocating NAD(P) transhydrogenase subunit alpha
MTTVGVVRERAPGERRVAIVPDTVERLRAAGLDVLVEHGAGAGAWFADEDYERAGAELGSAADVIRRADIITCLTPADLTVHEGQTLVGLLDPTRRPEAVRAWAEAGATAVSLDLLPRTLSRAQVMDALSSQAAIAGYRAALLAAHTFDRYFPMLTTAAGTSRPAQVLVLGAGVAGLSAIGTARRLGAVVTAYDVRPAARAEVESLGGRFLELTSVESAAGAGGYARALTEAEQEAQLAELAEHIARFDVVITTAQVPGRRPPLLVTRDALAGLAPGSVVIDLAASEFGGNVEGSQPDETVVLARGVTVIGAGNLPATMPAAASAAFARNITALVTHLLRDGVVHVDLGDEIQAGVVVTHRGEVVNPTVAAAFDEAGVAIGGTP